jgi:hypothetical protein
VANMVTFVTPVLCDPLRADRTELIIVDPHAAHDPRYGSNDYDGSDTGTSDQYRCEHGAVSIWRTREDFKLLLLFNRRLSATAWVIDGSSRRSIVSSRTNMVMQPSGHHVRAVTRLARWACQGRQPREGLERSGKP